MRQDSSRCSQAGKALPMPALTPVWFLTTGNALLLPIFSVLLPGPSHSTPTPLDLMGFSSEGFRNIDSRC
jgi:hypothetical protein